MSHAMKLLGRSIIDIVKIADMAFTLLHCALI